MNPDTNRFEPLHEASLEETAKHRQNREAMERMLKGAALVRPDGSPVPAHWSTFQLGEHVVIKNYTFKVAYVGESSILFEPVGPVVVGEGMP
jgi:hypothetical protein